MITNYFEISLAFFVIKLISSALKGKELNSDRFLTLLISALFWPFTVASWIYKKIF